MQLSLAGIREVLARMPVQLGMCSRSIPPHRKVEVMTIVTTIINIIIVIVITIIVIFIGQASSLRCKPTLATRPLARAVSCDCIAGQQHHQQRQRRRHQHQRQRQRQHQQQQEKDSGVALSALQRHDAQFIAGAEECEERLC